jgi:hypothetical protein
MGIFRNIKISIKNLFHYTTSIVLTANRPAWSASSALMVLVPVDAPAVVIVIVRPAAEIDVVTPWEGVTMTLVARTAGSAGSTSQIGRAHV